MTRKSKTNIVLREGDDVDSLKAWNLVKYLIRIGSGGFNKVAVVQCIQTGDFLVAKTPEISFENTRTFAQTEASILRKLDSPYFPKLKVSFKSCGII